MLSVLFVVAFCGAEGVEPVDLVPKLFESEGTEPQKKNETASEDEKAWQEMQGRENEKRLAELNDKREETKKFDEKKKAKRRNIEVISMIVGVVILVLYFMSKSPPLNRKKLDV